MNETTGELAPEEFPDEAEHEPPYEDTTEQEREGSNNGSGGEGLTQGMSLEQMVLHHSALFNQLGEAVQLGQNQTDGALAHLGATMAHIADEVKALKASPPATEPDPWNWKHLTGEPAAELLDTIRDWVDWYNGRYGVAEEIRIPGCWYLHPPVVEEITALRVAWQAAFYGHNKPDTAATYWHSAYLWPTIKRIRTEAWGLKRCLQAHQAYRPIPNQSTDNGYKVLRAALQKETATPIIPWPGHTPPPVLEIGHPTTAPIPTVQPAVTHPANPLR